MVFGLVGNSPEVVFRNWLTFHLRQCLVEQESIAFHDKRGVLNEEDIKQMFNIRIKEEVLDKSIIYSHLGRQAFFGKIFAVKDFLITWKDENWQIITFFDLEKGPTFYGLRKALFRIFRVRNLRRLGLSD